MNGRRTSHGNSLQEMLGAYERADSARFHMPGHKGLGMAGFWRDELVRWDVTEISQTDNLHAPHAAIESAQREMALAYGARTSFFVVNGSTNAVQAMLFALEERDTLLLSRDCHRAAIYGAALKGIETAFFSPQYDEKIQLPGMATAEELDRALDATHATAVMITSPNVYGCCADIPALVETAHRHGALLLVDSAHGAHFPFSDALPKPLGGFADLFAHSQHKTMDALTQAASLHLGECRISEDRVRRALAMTETTSPSYLLMTSLDWSIYIARRRDWAGQVERCILLESQIEQIDGLTALHGAMTQLGIYDRDRTRLVIDVSARGLTGYEAQNLLEKDGIYIEMADSSRLVLITTPNDEPVWYERLLSSLAKLPIKPVRKPKPLPEKSKLFAVEQAMRLRDAVFASAEQIPLESADGRVASEAIGVYPPGIARVMPGERIDADAIADLQNEQRNGGTLFGVCENGLIMVRQECE